MYLGIIVSGIAWLASQGTKLIIKSGRKRISWKDVLSYSDMPSSHTATVIGLATYIGLAEGTSSPIFATAIILAVIVITDAIGLRNYLGQHGKTLNVLVKDLKEDDFLDNRYPKQLEHIGHTPLQVLIGGLIGILVAIFTFLIAKAIG
jgi:hypothetical protein